MDRHGQIVDVLAHSVGAFFKEKQPYRIFHGSSNSTRPRPTGNVVDISVLNQVLSVDAARRTALLEPNVPMDRLVEATLAHGLLPPVVMEFPGITAGGGYSGTSGESSSFRHGFFNDTINYVDMILGNGDIVRASPTERRDLFYGAAGAAGTLGITTLMEIRLIEAKPFVKTTYQRTSTVGESVSLVQSKSREENLDYVDGIVFSKGHGVIITGEMVDELPPHGGPPQTFSKASDPWYYLHVQEKTKDLAPQSVAVEYIPIGEYLFRYDRAGFWVGRQGYTYFKYIPFNAFFRWLLDDFSHTRTLYHALHASGVSNQFVVQDLALPYDTAEQFIDFVDAELGIWPLWLCPLRGASTPTFHPVTGSQGARTEHDAAGLSQPMLNIGVWGWGPLDYDDFVAKNQELEARLDALGGRKWLYAHTYYSEQEFWQVYDKPWYQALRTKYHASTLPSVYDKVRIDVDEERRQRRQWTSSWSRAWPWGGLYGMWLAATSGDIRLHRRAQWKYGAAPA
ncbi:galactose-1-phosphate uridylyltransferase [Cordyceps militaris CM01]|uniref:Delta(24)-sterol reductase n=1 Tax=Cordyceps militaris (strain CM01) TaxID=983644 RepID=G3JRI6_CORMM|nr:galactose-1-phosphate uridylyltransferase [Cordyceps militaris CM01]EGX88589.1 galactose-1-phosphate uridylyltransferase [Cordyceps militaris CM01]